MPGKNKALFGIFLFVNKLFSNKALFGTSLFGKTTSVGARPPSNKEKNITNKTLFVILKIENKALFVPFFFLFATFFFLFVIFYFQIRLFFSYL